MKLSYLSKSIHYCVLLIGIISTHLAFGQQKMQSGEHNYTSFSEIKHADAKELSRFSDAKDHPEYGQLPFNAPCDDCIELIEERTEYTRKYLRVGTDGKEFLTQKGYSPLHYKDNFGRWMTYNPKLKKSTQSKYYVDNPFYNITIDAANGFIQFKNKTKGYKPLTFHKQLTFEELDHQGNVIQTIPSNWSTFTAGEEGLYVKNIFPNIDLEILVYRETIKTSFHVNQDVGKFRIRETANSDFINGLNQNLNKYEVLSIYQSGEQAYEIGELKIFGKNSGNTPRQSILKGHYSVEGNDILYNWNQTEFGQLNYPVIIDPTVTSTGSLPQGSITGSGTNVNAGNFDVGCLYNLSVPTPANCQITDIQWSFTYSAQNGGVLADGACKFYYGTCESPSAAGFYWFCNDPAAGGTCTGTDISIFSDFQTCIPAPQCASYNMDFTMEFYDAWGSFSALNCDPTYVSAASDWTMTITGETVDQPSAPTSSSGTTICEGSSTDLSATGNFGVPPYTYSWDNGGGVGNPVTVSPTTTTTYTCTITDACGVTANNSITINVQAAPDAGTNNSITVCSTDPVISLLGQLGGTPDATGTWTGPSGLGGGSSGNFDPASDAAGVYTYTVAGTAPCSDASATVTVAFDPLPDAGSNGTVSFCPTDPSDDLFNHLGGTPDAGGTWSPALASGTGVFDPSVDGAGTYTYSVTNPCGTATADVTVTINPAPDAGTNGSLTICATDPSTDLFNELGGTPDAGGTWSPALASGTGVFDPSVDAAGTYTYSVTNSCGTATADVTVSVVAAPDAGTNGTATFCPSDPSDDLFNYLGGTPDAGGTWSPALASGTGVFDPSVDAAGTYTYTVTASCGTSTADVTVTINPAPDAGTNGSLTICATDPSTDLFNELGGTPDAGGTWSPALASGTGVFDPSVDAAGTYTYSVTNSCGTATADVTVSVVAAPDAGTNGTATFCPSDASDDLFNYLGGTPDAGGTWSPALASGTGVFDPSVDAAGTYTYTVTASCGTSTADVTVTINPAPDAGTNGSLTICATDPSTDLFNELGGTPDAGGTWSPALASGTGVFDPSVDAAGTYTYSVTNSCGTATADVTVSVVSSPDAGTNGTATFCPSDASDDLFNYLGGTPDAGGTWSPALASGTGVFDPSVDAGGTYTYTVSASCGTSTADVVVTVNPAPDAGTNGTATFCPSDPSGDLFNSLGGTPDAGGTWSPAMASGTGVFDPSVDAAGTYTYTVTNSCGTTTADVVVSINSNPDPGTNGTATFCANDASDDLFNYLGGTPDGGGTWSPALASGTGVFDPSVDAAGTYTYTLNACGGGTLTADVIVTVNPLPVAGTNGALTLCSTDSPVDLFNSLGGSPDAGGTWSPALNSGSGTFDPSVDSSGTYTYTVTNSCGTESADVVVTVNPCLPPEPGFTMSDTSICLGECITLTDTTLNNPTSWLWIIGDTTYSDTATIQNPTFCPDTAGVFDIKLIVDNANGTDSTTQTITVGVIPTVFGVGDTVIDMNGEATLSSSVSPAGGTYVWTDLEDDETFDCIDCPTIYASPILDQDYVVTYATAEGCSASDTVSVFVNFLDLIDVPNGFSPNGDGNNDVLYVLGDGIVTMNFVIYNRYGQKIFETDNQKIGWDGTFRGTPENPGVFVWYVEYTLIDGSTNMKKGNVTLLK